MCIFCAMNVEKIVNTPKQIIALTSLTYEEFVLLRRPFEHAWRQWYKHFDFRFKRRRSPLGGGQLDAPTKTLPTINDKLFFILYHFKTNKLQEDLAAIFEMDQGQVSVWIRVLEPLLHKAIKKLKLAPARTPEELAQLFRNRQEMSKQKSTKVPYQVDVSSKPPARTLNVDATDRPIGRHVDNETQRLFYTRKHHMHSVKNTVCCDEFQYVFFIGETRRGARHDKAIIDDDLPDLHYDCFQDIWLSKDTGYQGYQPRGVHLLEPIKKPKGEELTAFQKEFNHWISRVRITVENAIGSIKKLRLISEKWRGKTLDRLDRCLDIAAGLHNLRILTRRTTYQKAEIRIQNLLG